MRLNLAINLALLILVFILVHQSRSNSAELGELKGRLDNHIADTTHEAEIENAQTAGGAPGL
jgi:hypothetical protein